MSESEKNLDDVCEFIVDCLHATAPVQEDGFPLIRTPNIGRGRLLLDGVYRVSEDTYDEWTRRAKPEADDLILAREAPAGNVAIVKNGQTVCLGQRTVHLRPDTRQVDPDFLCYYLLAPQQQGLLLAAETGATAKHVNMKDIRRLPLRNMPNIENQRRAGRFLATYDDIIENNRRRITLLEQAARLLYKEWFVHLRFPGHEHTSIINGVPEGWERKRLGEIATILKGKKIAQEMTEDGNVPVVAGGLKPAYYHNTANALGPVITVSASGANAGYVALYHQDIWASDCSYLSSSDNPEIWFLYLAMKSSQAEITGMQQGSAQPHVYPKHLKCLCLQNPPKTLRKHFHETVESSFLQIENLEKQIVKLARARDLLLPKLMNGEVAV